MTDDDDPCECGHSYSQHPDGGRCTGLDSYGVRCACPFPVPWTEAGAS
jgi:hypothetical protein